MRRMDRYKDETAPTEKRSVRNQELYQDVLTNTKYTNITDVTNANAYEIDNNSRKERQTRESYQKMRKYGSVDEVKVEKKRLDDFNYLYKRNEHKVYDINSVLEEARKNRKEKDELDSKRKLKNQSYNILAGLNMEELEKYREEKKNKIYNDDEKTEELREIIDTITTKTLAGEIDQETTVNLLSDLMATNMLDKVKNPDEIDEDTKDVVSPADELKEPVEEEKAEEIDEKLSLSKEILDQEQMQELEKLEKKELENTTKIENADQDFYTKSMDLSDQDFEMSDDFKEKKLPGIVKFLITVIILSIIAVAGYFIYLKLQ